MSKFEIALLIVSAVLLAFAILGLAAGNLALVGADIQVFEDGSFVATGCLPLAICNR